MEFHEKMCDKMSQNCRARALLLPQILITINFKFRCKILL